ncbi:hypothetical protein SAMN04488082_111107 [Desulfomicrobium apsheronum]|uniref:Uncharacterized protein n=1 Tax=Desulfomicrobium apsheronum TaxID=52560 RepID=A0A1I3VY78_9BACT|nr:hypothetical protein SAMN04488082_111107 [Desulfomicrobium apsheronum]
MEMTCIYIQVTSISCVSSSFVFDSASARYVRKVASKSAQSALTSQELVMNIDAR